MKNNKTCNVRLLFVIVIMLNQFSLNLYAQLGKSCPPCTQEFADLKIAGADFLVAVTNYTDAYMEFKDHAAKLAVANKASVAAKSAYMSSCASPIPLNKTASCAYDYLNCQLLDNAAENARLQLAPFTIALQEATTELKRAEAAKILSQKLYDLCMARPYLICQKCSSGIVVPDDSQIPLNICAECIGGFAVNVDDENMIPPCTKCINKKLVDLCSPTEVCCNGVCKTVKYSYTVTTIVTTCNGDSPPVVKSFITTSPNSPKASDIQTGKLFYSYGRCTGGSITKIHTTAPVAIPPCD